MATALQTVLEIAGVGTMLLFIALAGLVGLMYSLTSPWVYDRFSTSTVNIPGANTEADTRTGQAIAQAKHDTDAETSRQLQAVALAVAVSCAIAEQPTVNILQEPSEWRRIHRARRFSLSNRRQRIQS